MPQNQFLPVATGDGANTLTAAQYAALGVLAQGFQSGVLPSIQFNTVLRQLSTVVAALGQFTADNQEADVLDDGIVFSFESKFRAALKGALSSSSVHYGIATGTGDALVVTAIPPMMPTATGGYQPGSFLVVKTPSTPNTSTAPTVNANSIGNIAITKRGSAPVAKGDLPAATWTILFFDGTGCFCLASLSSDILQAIPAGALWHVGVDTSATAGQIVAPVTPAVTTRIAHLAYLIFPDTACVGATQIDVGFGLQPLTRSDGASLVAKDYSAGQPLVVIDDGTKFRISDLVPSEIATALPDAQVWHTGTAGGTAAALTTTLSPVPAAGASGFFIGLAMPAGLTNAAGGSLDFGLGPKPLALNSGGTALVGGELGQASEAILFYDGTSVRVLTSTAPPAGTVTTTSIAAPGVALPRVFAWGNIDATSGVPVFTNGGGIASISQVHASNGGTNYTIFFTNAMPDTDFTALFSVVSYNDDTVALTAQESINSRTTHSVTVLIDAPAYSAGIFDRFSIMIFHS